MRFQPELSTYSHFPQRKKKEQKERNDYDYSFSLLNPEGTIHLLLKGDILTSYEHIQFQNLRGNLRLDRRGLSAPFLFGQAD